MKKVLSVIPVVAMFLSIFSMVTFAAVDNNIVQSYMDIHGGR